jgi:hypothetical protein
VWTDWVKFFFLPLEETEKMIAWAISGIAYGMTSFSTHTVAHLQGMVATPVRNFFSPILTGTGGPFLTLAAFLVGAALYVAYRRFSRDRLDLAADAMMRIERQPIFEDQRSIFIQEGALVEGDQPATDASSNGMASSDDNEEVLGGVVAGDPVGGDNPARQPIPQRRVRNARHGVNIAIAEMKLRFPYSRVRKVVLRGLDSAEADAERTCIKSELLMWMQQNNWRATDRRLYADEIVAAMFFPSALEIRAGALMTEAIADHSRNFHDAILAGEDSRGATLRAPPTTWLARLLAQCGFRY